MNNEAALKLGRADLDLADVKALADRLLYVGGREHEPAVQAVVEFILRLEREAPGEIPSWVNEEKIARHALWLRDQQGWATGAKKTGRFLVPGNGERSGERLLVADKLSAAVLEWVFRQVVARVPNRQILIRDGKVWLRASILAGLPGVEMERPLDLEQASRVLGKLAPGERRNFRVAGKSTPLRGIDLGMLRRFGDAHDLDVDAFDAAVLVAPVPEAA